MVQEMTIDELVDSYEEYFPCTFIHRYTKDVGDRGQPVPAITAFDVDKAREYVAMHGWTGECGDVRIRSRMADLLPERCLFEELVRAAAHKHWDFLDEDCVRVRVTDE